MNSNMPEWIKKLQKEDAEATLMEETPSGSLAYEALAIAWEALEYGFNGRTIKQSGMSVQSRPLTNSELRLSLENAMRRIEELGKENT